jgi:hypothetical protein
VVSIDALPFAADRSAALREAGRILVPGGRMVLTVREQPADADDWATMAARGGLDVEQSEAIENHEVFWQRLFTSWLGHAEELRAELGERAAGYLLLEANLPRSALGKRRALLLVMRRREN